MEEDYKKHILKAEIRRILYNLEHLIDDVEYLAQMLDLNEEEDFAIRKQAKLDMFWAHPPPEHDASTTKKRVEEATTAQNRRLDDSKSNSERLSVSPKLKSRLEEMDDEDSDDEAEKEAFISRAKAEGYAENDYVTLDASPPKARKATKQAQEQLIAEKEGDYAIPEAKPANDRTEEPKGRGRPMKDTKKPGWLTEKVFGRKPTQKTEGEMLEEEIAEQMRQVEADKQARKVKRSSYG